MRTLAVQAFSALTILCLQGCMDQERMPDGAIEIWCNDYAVTGDTNGNLSMSPFDCGYDVQKLGSAWIIQALAQPVNLQSVRVTSDLVVVTGAKDIYAAKLVVEPKTSIMRVDLKGSGKFIVTEGKVHDGESGVYYTGDETKDSRLIQLGEFFEPSKALKAGDAVESAKKLIALQIPAPGMSAVGNADLFREPPLAAVTRGEQHHQQQQQKSGPIAVVAGQTVQNNHNQNDRLHQQKPGTVQANGNNGQQQQNSSTPPVHESDKKKEGFWNGIWNDLTETFGFAPAESSPEQNSAQQSTLPVAQQAQIPPPPKTQTPTQTHTNMQHGVHVNGKVTTPGNRENHTAGTMSLEDAQPAPATIPQAAQVQQTNTQAANIPPTTAPMLAAMQSNDKKAAMPQQQQQEQLNANNQSATSVTKPATPTATPIAVAPAQSPQDTNKQKQSVQTTVQTPVSANNNNNNSAAPQPQVLLQHIEQQQQPVSTLSGILTTLTGRQQQQQQQRQQPQQAQQAQQQGSQLQPQAGQQVGQPAEVVVPASGTTPLGQSILPTGQVQAQPQHQTVMHHPSEMRNDVPVVRKTAF